MIHRKMGRSFSIVLLAFAPAVFTFPSTVDAQPQVTAELVLTKYSPSQRDSQVETPAKADFEKCRIDVEQVGKGTGYVVYGPQGQLLRRFADTDGNGTVDQWRYYQHGVEVYRDIDSNGNNKVDQCRWLNAGGTRWGIDANEDGRIDRWKMISAEETTREAIKAMTSGDDKALAALLIDEGDVRTLKISKELSAPLLASTADPAAQMRKILSQSKVLQSGTQWTRFDTSMLMPSVIPAESGKAEEDLYVYENVMAYVETGGETRFVQIGEMVRVGDVWKLTRVPQPLEGDTIEVTEGGLLMQPVMASTGPGGGPIELSPQVRELIDRLSALDKAAPTAESSRDDMSKYNTARAKLLGELARVSTTEDERAQWQRQQIDIIAAGVQMGTYPKGLDELEALEAAIRRGAAESELVPYAAFRRLLADYNVKLQSSEAADRAKVQEVWLKSLEDFIKAYPKSEDSPDAILQLAITNEFNGKVDEAKAWYQQLANGYRGTPAATRALGALRRLGLKGSSLAFTGAALGGGNIDLSRYRGKAVAVVFWATWCKPCTEDLPSLLELYKQYQRAGFEVVGVNLDMPDAPIKDYIQQYKIPWPHIHEPGSLESRPAQEFGIITLPTIFLVDKSGKVVSSGASLDDLKKLVPELVK